MVSLNWVSSYEVRSDGTMSDQSCKHYLEDLLRGVRHALERTRHSSTSSGGSGSSGMSAASTPKKKDKPYSMVRTPSMDSDMRYMKAKIKLD